MGNIFVSEHDHTKIESLIDWQSASVFPMFLQARWPVFLDPPDGYCRGFENPKLPENFSQMDSDQKKMAIYVKDQAARTKAYELNSFLNNRDAYHAMNVTGLVRDLFIRCGDVWENGIVPLQACLVEISQAWSEMGFPGECPFTLSEEELAKHEREFEVYQDWQKVQEIARQQLDADFEGWVPAEENWDEKRAQNQALLEYFIKVMASEKSAEEAKKMWPFIDRD